MSAGPAAVRKIENLRYYVLLLIFAVTAVNYADRAIVSIAGPAMADELGLDPVALVSYLVIVGKIERVELRMAP